MTDPTKLIAPAVTPRQDGQALHFLKEFPAWCILLLLIGIFLGMYHFTREDFIPRIIDGLVGAMLTAIIAQRPRAQQPPPANISAETLNTDSLNVENKNKGDN